MVDLQLPEPRVGFFSSEVADAAFWERVGALFEDAGENGELEGLDRLL